MQKSTKVIADYKHEVLEAVPSSKRAFYGAIVAHTFQLGLNDGRLAVLLLPNR